jgi:hypothetical protein
MRLDIPKAPDACRGGHRDRAQAGNAYSTGQAKAWIRREAPSQATPGYNNTGACLRHEVKIKLEKPQVSATAAEVLRHKRRGMRLRAGLDMSVETAGKARIQRGHVPAPRRNEAEYNTGFRRPGYNAGGAPVLPQAGMPILLTGAWTRGSTSVDTGCGDGEWAPLS